MEKELKANELSINNLIRDGEIILKVKEIKGAYIVTHQKGFFKSKLRRVEIFSGIKLNQDWLKKLGFESGFDSKNTVWYHSIHDNDFILDTSEFVSLAGVPEFEIKHVHQLQNIYRALTGFSLSLVA